MKITIFIIGLLVGFMIALTSIRYVATNHCEKEGWDEWTTDGCIYAKWRYENPYYYKK